MGYREARVRQHLAESFRVDRQPRRWRGGNHRREIVGRQADELVRDAGAAKADRRVLAHLQGQRRGRKLLHDLRQLTRRDRDRPFRCHARWNCDPRSDLEIRRRQANGFPVGFEQHVRENREGLAGLDDVLDHLEALEERITIQDYFHEVLRCCLEK